MFQWNVTKYMTALFGSELDEDNVPYTTTYEYELEGLTLDLSNDIEYINGDEHLSTFEKYNYYKVLLIQSSRTFLNSFTEIKRPELLDEIALEMARQ